MAGCYRLPSQCCYQPRRKRYQSDQNALHGQGLALFGLGIEIYEGKYVEPAEPRDENQKSVSSEGAFCFQSGIMRCNPLSIKAVCGCFHNEQIMELSVDELKALKPKGQHHQSKFGGLIS